MKRNFFLFLTLLFCCSTIVYAQQTDSAEAYSKFRLSVNHNSGLNYFGRTDSLKSKGVFPMAELWLSKSLYVNAAPIFVYNKLQSLDYAGSVATIGVLNVSSRWISNLYLLKPFYKESSELVQSALKMQSGASFTFLNNVLNLTAGGDIKLSDRIDFGATAAVDHIFRIENAGSGFLVIDPSFTINAGTQNFSNTYTKRAGGLLPREERITETYQNFNILSLEAAIPIVYTLGKFQVIATPSYVMPKNLLKVAGRPDLSEAGENMFYSSLALKYNF